jgi:hypothetical protein
VFDAEIESAKTGAQLRKNAPARSIILGTVNRFIMNELLSYTAQTDHPAKDNRVHMWDNCNWPAMKTGHVNYCAMSR